MHSYAVKSSNAFLLYLVGRCPPPLPGCTWVIRKVHYGVQGFFPEVHHTLLVLDISGRSIPSHGNCMLPRSKTLVEMPSAGGHSLDSVGQVLVGLMSGWRLYSSSV